MRCCLTLGLSIALCASANAATLHHAKPRHVMVRHGRDLTFGRDIPGFAYVPARSPVHYDDTPSYDDPSKFGGQ